VTEPDWIDAQTARALNDRLLAAYGGQGGLRDAGLLESALSRPRHRFAYRRESRITDLAASYTAAIVQDHPFIDGNKRTAFLVGVLFLEMNGCRFTASEEHAAVAVAGLATGTLHEAAYAAFLSDHVE
jgi:death-on-curing protein